MTVDVLSPKETQRRAATEGGPFPVFGIHAGRARLRYLKWVIFRVVSSRVRLRSWLAASVALVSVVLAVAPARAATVAYLTDGQLAAGSDRIVHGRVVAVRVEPGSGGRVYTVATVEVIEDLTGIDRPTVEIRELGGRVGTTAMVVSGMPSLEPGAEILACLERRRDGRGHRLLALGFSLFTVAPDVSASDGALRRQDQDLVVLDRPPRDGSSRTLREFRRVVGAVRGTAPRRFPARRPGQAALGAATPGAAAAAADSGLQALPAAVRNFTLLGGGSRWHEVDEGATIEWFRNSGAPAPVDGSDGTAEILTALSAWTTAETAVITLSYAGPRGIGSRSPYCDTTNAGVGLISFEDPTDEIAAGVLAIGGGCTTTEGRKVVNGVTFDGFTHGFAVLNDTASVGASYRTPLNFARLVEHEVGHGIGLGHNVPSAAGAQSNIMYATCCYASTPVPPALGPDDLAGIEFIYPVPGGETCEFSVAPTTFRPGYMATEGSVDVDVNLQSCTWTATSASSWIRLVPPATVTGSGRLAFLVEANHAGERTGTLTVAGESVSVTQEAYDTDLDGLPDAWERATGLDPLSGTGDDGASGDADADGMTNLVEWQTGGHPRGFYRTYLAEGVASRFFFTETAVAAAVSPPRGAFYVRYAYRLPSQPPAECEAGFEVTASRWFHVPATACGSAPGGDVEVSPVIESDVPLVVERTLSWPFQSATGPQATVPTLDAYGAHADGDVSAPSTRWYFAEGATLPGFDLFYLVRNVETRPVTVTATYLRPAPRAPVVREYVVQADARLTIWANVDDDRLASTEMAAIFESDGGRVVVERAMYASTPDQPFAAGTAAMGSTAPATRWLFAEGATGAFFDTFLLLANPDDEPATVQVRYMLPLGSTLVRSYTVGARARLSIWADLEDPALSDTPFAADVVSTNGVPIVAERVMWWPGAGSETPWYEAHVSGGAREAARHWLTSDGECGGERHARTYLLLANPGADAVTVTVQLQFDNGVSGARQFTLFPRARFDIDVGAQFPEADGRRFAADIAVLDPDAGAVVVERSTYWDGRQQGWAAGVNVRATIVP